MDVGDFELLICSPVDKEKLVCEINYQDDFFAEISQETGEFKITIISCPEHKFWTFSLEQYIDVLEKAKKHLIGG